MPNFRFPRILHALCLTAVGVHISSSNLLNIQMRQVPDFSLWYTTEEIVAKRGYMRALIFRLAGCLDPEALPSAAIPRAQRANDGDQAASKKGDSCKPEESFVNSRSKYSGVNFHANCLMPTECPPLLFR